MTTSQPQPQPMSQWPSPFDYTLSPVTGNTVSITVDGRAVQVPEGELLIKAAQDHGTYIPRFCWHERLKPVGMCRVCLVEVEGLRGLQIACATTVTDGMVVNTQSPTVRLAQDGVLELLLINHPLDCPVCDRGGECPLQDQTLSFGPGESRFIEEKRHWEKPIPISQLVLLDRERCIQCGRCTRFAAEVAGDPLIDFGDRGALTEVIAYPDEPFSSYFSGNIVQICPVGALTAQPYRFKARPWDLESVETSCTTCAVGCRGALQSSSNRLVRLLGVDTDPVNHGWLCDKGRFGYELVHSDDRVRNPMVRKQGELVECSWPEALDAAAEGLQRVLDLHGAQTVAALGGARGTNEDAYAWARLLKGVIGTDHVDAQLDDGLPPDVVLGLPSASIDDLDTAAAIVLLGPDLKEELPVLYLRVRRAAAEVGIPLIDVAPTENSLSRYASAHLRYVPGEQGETARKLANALGGANTGDAAVDAAAALVRDREGDIIVILGRGSVAESSDSTVAAAGALMARRNVRFLSALRRGNVRGAIDLGLTPGFLPGRVTLDAGREWFTHHWGQVPKSAGLDARGILDSSRQGRIHALILLGTDAIDDFPDGELAQGGVEGAGFVVAVDAFVTGTNQHADVFLPVTMWGEQGGTTTNLEGRVLRLGQKISPDGTALPDWRIAAELAMRLGVDFDLETVEEIQDEIARVAPAHAEVDSRLVRRALDGVVLPIAEHRDSVVLGPIRIPLTDASWEPIRPAAAGIDAGAAATDVSPEAEPDVTPEVTPAVPALHVYVNGAPSGPASPRDAYALRLVAGRTLYDDGILVAASPSLESLAPEPVLRVHPHDRDRLGVTDGATVRVTTPRGSLTVAIVGDLGVPQGVAAMPFNRGEHGVSELIDATASVTDLRVETVQ